MRVQAALSLFLISLAAIGQSSQPLVAPTLLRTAQFQAPLTQAVLQRQFDTLSAMRLSSLQYSVYGPVQQIEGELGVVLPQAAKKLKKGDTAEAVLSLFKDVLLANGSESAIVTKHYPDEVPAVMVLRQTIQGIPVFLGDIALSYDQATLRVSSFSGHFLPDRGLSRTPKIPASKAEQIVPEVLAKAAKESVDIEIRTGTHLEYYADFAGGSAPVLVWAVPTDVGTSQATFLVDATTGEIVYRLNESTSVREWTNTVHDANYGSPSVNARFRPQ